MAVDTLGPATDSDPEPQPSRTLYDLLPKNEAGDFITSEGHFVREQDLRPDAAKVLRTPIPKSIPDAVARQAAQKVHEALPRLTTAAQTIGRANATYTPERARADAESQFVASQRARHAGLPLAARMGEEALIGFGQAEPSRNLTGRTPGDFIEPKGVGEHAARTVGSLLPFASETAIGMAANIPAPLAMGAAAASGAGTPGQRVVRGATTAATSGIVGAVAPETAPLAQKLAAGAIGFGVVQPLEEVGAGRAAGAIAPKFAAAQQLPTQAPSIAEMGRNFLTQTLLGLLPVERRAALDNGAKLTETLRASPHAIETPEGRIEDPVPLAATVHPNGEVRLLLQNPADGRVMAGRYQNLSQLAQAIRPANAAPAEATRPPGFQNRGETMLAAQERRAGEGLMRPNPEAASQALKDRSGRVEQAVRTLTQKIAESPGDAKRGQWENKLARLKDEQARISRLTAPESGRAETLTPAKKGSSSKETASGKVPVENAASATPKPAPEVRAGGSSERMGTPPTLALTPAEPRPRSETRPIPEPTRVGPGAGAVAAEAKGGPPAAEREHAPAPQPSTSTQLREQAEAARKEGRPEHEVAALEHAAGQAEAKETREAREAAGQQDIFGGAMRIGDEKPPVVPEVSRGTVDRGQPPAVTYGEGGNVETRETREPTTHPEVRYGTLNFHPGFQQEGRAEEGLPIDREKINAHLEKRGGYSPSDMARNPLTFWTDRGNELGQGEGSRYVISGHHRAWLGQHTWDRVEGEPGKWHATGPSDRSGPAVEIHGELAHAQRVAQMSNLEGIPNSYSQKAQIVARLEGEGKSWEEIAANVEGIGKGKAQAMSNFAQLAPAVRKTFFPDGREESVLGGTTHGEVLGKWVARDPRIFTPDHQMNWMHTAMRDGLTAGAFNDQIKGWHEFVTAAKQEEIALPGGGKGIKLAMTGAEFNHALGRLYRETTSLKTQARTALSYAEKHGHDAYAKTVKADLDKIAKVHEEVRPLMLEALKRVGQFEEKPAEAFARVRAEVEKRMGAEGPRSWGAFSKDEAGEFRPGQILHAIAHWIDVPRMMEAAMRREPEVNRLRERDAEGRIVRNGRLMDVPVSDPYSEAAHFRALADHGLVGAHIVYPPEIRGHLYAGDLKHDAMEAQNFDALRWALGRDGMRKVVQDGSADMRIEAHLNGEKVALSPVEKEIAERGRHLRDELFKTLNEARKARGMEEAQRLESYSPHKFVGVVRNEMEDLFKRFMGRDVASGEVLEASHRFLYHRSGAESYERRGFIQTQMDYASAISRYVAYGPFHDALMAYAGHPPEGMKPEAWHGEGVTEQGVRRWDAMAKHYNAVFMRPRSTAEQNVNRVMRASLFLRARGGSIALEPAQVDALMQASPTEWTRGQAAKLEHEAFVHVPKGQEVTFTDAGREGGTRWRLVGTDAKGNRIYGGPESSHVQDVTTAQLRPAFETAYKGWRQLNLAARGHLGNPEARLADARRSQESLERFAQEPLNAFTGLVSNQTRHALLGLNTRAWNVIAGSNLLAPIETFGLRGFIHGAVKYGQAMSRSAAREGVTRWADFLESRKAITPERATALRAAIPHIADEVLIDMARSESHRERQNLKQELADAQAHGLLQRVSAAMLNHSDTLNPLVSLASWNRAVQFVQAWHAAKAEGRATPGILNEAHVREGEIEDWRNQFIESSRDPKSAAHAVSQAEMLTMAHYSRNSRVPWQTGPLGRIFANITSFPRHYMAMQEGYGGLGAARTVAAPLRAAYRMATGKGPVPEREGKTYVRHFSPRDPLDPVGVLEYGGANVHDRTMAKFYGRRLAVGAALLGLSVKTGVDMAIYTSPALLVGLLNVLHAMNPDEEKIKKAKEMAESGAFAHATAGAGLGIAGPLATQVFSSGQKALKNPPTSFTEAMQDFLVSPMAETGRWMTGAPVYAARRLVQNYPELVQEHAPWLFDALGAKSTYGSLDARQRALNLFGLLPPSEMKEGRTKVGGGGGGSKLPRPPALPIRHAGLPPRQIPALP